VTRTEIVDLFERRKVSWQQRDAGALSADHSDNGTLISPMAGLVKGRAAIEQIYQTWFAGFPNFTLQDEQLIVDGDRVVQVATVSGTDTGGFMELPPTGKAFRVPVVFVYTLSDGKITHSQTVYDFSGVLIQVGILRAKPA
jgi:predicted ester cyclase